MRLEWVRIDDPRFENGYVDVEFGGLTAVWGPNDAGKSTLLRAVHDALARETGRALDADPDSAATLSTIALSLTRPEADLLASFATDDLAERGRAEINVLNDWVQVTLHGEGWAQREAREHLHTRKMLRPWLDLCLAATDLAPATQEQIATHIERHRVVMLTPASAGGWHGGWAVRSDAEFLESANGSLEPWVHFLSAFIGPAVGSDGFPAPVAAPLEWTDLTSRLLARCGEAGEAFHYNVNGRTRWPVADGGLAADTEWDTADGYASRFLALALAAATRRAPPFVSGEYQLGSEGLGPADEAARLTVSRPGGLPFPVDRLAEGFQLWLQLAVQDTVEVIDTAADAFSRFEGVRPRSRSLCQILPTRWSKRTQERTRSIRGCPRWATSRGSGRPLAE